MNVLAKEMEYSSSPAGVLTRARDRVSEKLPGGNRHVGNEN